MIVLTDLELKHAQSVMLMMMKDIHRICIENDIRYWVDFGSLIGAIRHNGFIPWDDDFDICMFREDFNRFNQITQQKLGNKYFYQTMSSDKNWGALQTKVRLNGTTFLEEYFSKSNLSNNGFYIDIFPFDYVFKNKIIRWIHFTLSRYLVKLTLIKMKRTSKILNPILSLIPLHFLYITCEHIATLSKETDLVTHYTLGNPKGPLIEKKYLNELILHKFEDTHFYIPKEYDIRLKRMYGNYMIPPSETEQRGHHSIIKIDFGIY